MSRSWRLFAFVVAAVGCDRSNIKSDSVPSDPNGFTLRLGGFMVNGERNFAFNKAVKTGTGSLKGIDFLLRGSGAGIAVRSLAGTFTGQPDVIGANVDLLLGPPAFTVSVGGARRALSTTQVTQVYTFGRVGVQLSYLIGGTGIRGRSAPGDTCRHRRTRRG